MLPAALLALRSVVNESTGVTPFSCLHGREPATPLDVVSKVPGAPLAAHTYVHRLKDHQFRAHRAVQVQLALALHHTSRRYGDEKDAIQPGEKVWLFTSKPAADRKLAIPYSGPWKVTRQLAGTLRTIGPEGDWCRQPKDITVSLNRLKRCYGEVRAPQRVDHDLRKLEVTEDHAESPMMNAWITDKGAAAAQALNPEAGDVHAPGLREKTTSAAVPQPAPRLFSQHRDMEDMATFIVIHHERPAAVGPGSTSVNPDPASKIDSTTMTDPRLSNPEQPTLNPSRTWSAPRTQHLFDQSAQVRPCSSQVLEAKEVTLPPVLEELTDDVFARQPAPWPNRTTSTPATAPSLTSATAPSTTDTTPETDSGAEDRQGMKRQVSTSDTSYSQAHRTLVRGPSNYP